MASFIHDVLNDLKSKQVNFSELTFILPSKRAGIFLKQELTKLINTPIFSPKILSIEEFVEELAQLKKISNTELLFEFYTIYLKTTPKNQQDSLDIFCKWAQIILQDFNEIDRYLIPQKNIFDYLNAIQEINHWSLETNKTSLIENYLNFWKKLPEYYEALAERLKSQKRGYQGLQYREASKNIKNYIKTNPEQNFVFLGFNALNTAEEVIINELLNSNKASIYWDIDKTFVESPLHDAGYFIRHHKKNWSYLKKNPFYWLSNYYNQEKSINIYGVPKNIGQTKVVGALLEKIKNNSRTAVVLGNETLLTPLLNSIPENIDKVNITMGIPLNDIPLSSLFEFIFLIQKQNKEQLYYKNVINILSHEYIRPLFHLNGTDYVTQEIEKIKQHNTIYLTIDKLKHHFSHHKNLIELLFLPWKNNAEIALKNCNALIFEIKNYLNADKDKNLLALEYLYRFNKLFTELNKLNTTYNYITSTHTLHDIYKELLSSETLDFKGEPLEGLQIMGMLESRVLDFDTVIITSVNEGILPSGKTNNSFIPFDVKIENKLPTFKEKDAVYTYHFYRLLQRAKTVHILYNTEIDALTGGEKSRFISQLELDKTHNISHKIIAPEVPSLKQNKTQLSKSPELVNDLKHLAQKGFSPSSLTTYIRNPIDFYNQKLLGIYTQEDVEETIATNTFGTVIHNTLEQLYTPLINKPLLVEDIKALKAKVNTLVLQEFQTNYKKEDLTSGYNLIALEVAKRYVSNFLDYEIKDLQKGNSITIVALEQKETISLPITELDFEVKLTGTVDRIDNYNGTLRIIDYKTGNVQQNQVELVNWKDITTDYNKYSKSFQLLTYAYILNTKKAFTAPVEAGIISFKNLSNGFLKFAKKDKLGAYAKKDNYITQDTLHLFFKELKTLILEIMDPEIDFVEKET